MKIKKIDVPFTQVINSILYNKDLSLKAKGMFAYIQAKPDDYDFSTDRIPLENKDGRDSVRSALKELQDKGFLKRKRNTDGTMSYELFAKLEPPSGNPTVGKTHSGKSRRIIKKEYIQRKNNTNTLQAELATENFILDEKLKEMEKIPNSLFDHIASFIRFKGKEIEIENNKQLSEIISRFSRVAKKIAEAKYSTDRVHKKMEYLQKKYEHELSTLGELKTMKWTLETVYKELTK